MCPRKLTRKLVEGLCKSRGLLYMVYGIRMCSIKCIISMGLDPETAKTARVTGDFAQYRVKVNKLPVFAVSHNGRYRTSSAEVVIDGGQLETNRNWVQDGLGLCDDSEPTRDKYHRAWVRGQYHWSKVNQHAALMFRYYSAVRHG